MQGIGGFMWRLVIKDYERDKDAQGSFCCRQLAKNENCMYWAFICMIRYFGQSATVKLTHVFMVAKGWVIVDFDEHYKIVCGEKSMLCIWNTILGTALKSLNVNCALAL